MRTAAGPHNVVGVEGMGQMGKGRKRETYGGVGGGVGEFFAGELGEPFLFGVGGGGGRGGVVDAGDDERHGEGML